MAVIQGLPEDLLIAIFRTIQRQDLRPHSTQPPPRYCAIFRRLTCLSLVCKGWREILLQHGLFWTHIPVDNTRSGTLKAILTMLQRSEGAELSLSAHLTVDSRTAEETGQIMKAILGQRSRVVSMHITADPRCIFDGNTPPSEPTASIGSDPSQSISSLLNGLRRLAFSLPSPTMTVDVSSLLHIIRASPGLESLHLTSFISIKEDRPAACVVHAPRLQRLSFRKCSSAIILSHITMPRGAVIEITMGRRRISGEHGASPPGYHILDSLPHSLANIPALEGAELLILEGDEEKGTFCLGLSPFPSRGSSVVVRSHPSFIKSFVYHSLSAIANHSYFGVVKRFTFSYSSPVPISWSTVLGRFNLLLELNIPSNHGVGVICALMYTALNGFPLCSSLRRVRLFHQQPDITRNYLDPHLLTTFREFRAETRCSNVRITVHFPSGRKDEL